MEDPAPLFTPTASPPTPEDSAAMVSVRKPGRINIPGAPSSQLMILTPRPLTDEGRRLEKLFGTQVYNKEVESRLVEMMANYTEEATSFDPFQEAKGYADGNSVGSDCQSTPKSSTVSHSTTTDAVGNPKGGSKARGRNSGEVLDRFGFLREGGDDDNSHTRLDRYKSFYPIQVPDGHGVTSPTPDTDAAATIAVRAEKWAEMMSKYRTNGPSALKKLKERVRKGVPQQFRGELWQILLGISEDNVFTEAGGRKWSNLDYSKHKKEVQEANDIAIRQFQDMMHKLSSGDMGKSVGTKPIMSPLSSRSSLEQGGFSSPTPTRNAKSPEATKSKSGEVSNTTTQPSNKNSQSNRNSTPLAASPSGLLQSTAVLRIVSQAIARKSLTCSGLVNGTSTNSSSKNDNNSDNNSASPPIRLRGEKVLRQVLRGKLLRYPHDLTYGLYEFTQKLSTQHETTIAKDIVRTFPTMRDRHLMNEKILLSLFRILKSYAIVGSSGYCQGMPFICYLFLAHYQELDAWRAFVTLMEGFEPINASGSQERLGDKREKETKLFAGPDDDDGGLMRQWGRRRLFGSWNHVIFFQRNFTELRKYMFVLNKLMAVHVPAVHSHIEKHGIDMSVFSVDWFMTVFLYSAPFSVAICILDCYFSEGIKAVLRFALAYLSLMERGKKTLNPRAVTEYRKQHKNAKTIPGPYDRGYDSLFRFSLRLDREENGGTDIHYSICVLPMDETMTVLQAFAQNVCDYEILAELAFSFKISTSEFEKHLELYEKQSNK